MVVRVELHTPPVLPQEKGLPVCNDGRSQPHSEENAAVAVLAMCVAAFPGRYAQNIVCFTRAWRPHYEIQFVTQTLLRSLSFLEF